MYFYVRLKTLRESLGISSKDMAEKIGVAKSTYSQYESGKREPDVEKIKSIAEILNVSTDYLLFGRELPYDTNDIGIQMYKQLDAEDRAEIRGEMKQMLKAPKYNNATGSISDDILSDIKRLGAIVTERS